MLCISSRRLWTWFLWMILWSKAAAWAGTDSWGRMSTTILRTTATRWLICRLQIPKAFWLDISAASSERNQSTQPGSLPGELMSATQIVRRGAAAVWELVRFGPQISDLSWLYW